MIKLFSNKCIFVMLVSLGLLVVTGVLWGCTNPFIRQGTKGLRSVKAETWLGQAYAEIIFLLGNWRYVVPFLVNQCGSLVYLMAVQRAPLSLAVPASNSLAFAFTAVTGSMVGAEEPLDRGSILGILFIIIGTALCCWDKSY
ncbi:transmembrane protein 234 homolog [Papilio machaon]|nr:transmembrane protein 234 homolog [Papilio machaon]